MSVDISHLVMALGGTVVGKIRLQKVVYLLDQLGLDSGFDFDYHHYGPYSAGLAEAVDLKIIFGDLSEEQRRRQSDGVPYTVFTANTDVGRFKGEDVGDLKWLDVERYSALFEKYSATTLELAATAFWLAHEEQYTDWRSELVKRKGVKTENGRVEQATQLLKELGLSLK
ncbi:hypothetical protein [Paradevosia shaoguanensis]|uniref:hypothetical protein n=1 Tax=Paradevosia shaoguanensis TaxID=1335043 RepID=UPI0019328CD8|nr:hypothetical protein [Paradevosia shaoguanensis]